MNNEDFTRMAHEAGMVPHRPFTLAHLRDFAALVYERGVADERARLGSFVREMQLEAQQKGALGVFVV